MHKNQLQELAQRSSVNLPSYSCIREGPDHAPRFKAAVNFNGELFESPDYCSTLRQAEHAAAEVALNVLSTRGPSQSLAARVLDETGVCKNLLQETAQRAGVALPIYRTIKGSRGHGHMFTCTVEVGGRVFHGEPARTKKQAEKNAAMVAWSVIKQLTQPPMVNEGTSAGPKRGNNAGALTLYDTNDCTRSQSLHRRPQARAINRRERQPSREGSPGGQFRGRGSPMSSPSRESNYETQRFLFNQQPHVTSSDLARSRAARQRTHSWTGVDTRMPETFSLSRQSASGAGYIGPLPRQTQHRWRHQPQRLLSRLSLQSCSDRIELRRPFIEELQLLEKEQDDDWLRVLESTNTHVQPQQQPSMDLLERKNPCLYQRRALFQCQSERFELKPSLLDELYQRDDEDWWMQGEAAGWRGREGAHRHEGQGNHPHSYHDGNISLSPSHESELGNIGTSYNSAYRDSTGTAYGYSGNVAEIGSYGSYGDGSKCASSYAGFSNSPPTVPFCESNNERETGCSYGSFHVDPPSPPFSKHALSGYTFASSSSLKCEDEGGSSSASVWSDPAQWCMSRLPSNPSSSSWTVPGLCQPSSIAPPVRVRQTVAVCAAPQCSQIVVLDNASTAIWGMQSRAHQFEGSNTISVDAEDFTSDLFKELKL